MALEEFNKIYKYKSDKAKFGFNEVWELPKVSDDGFVYADCESYCRYLKNNIPEFKDWWYYYCTLNGIGHCVLYKNGDIIDCNIKRVISLEQYYKIYKVSELRKYSIIVVISKIVIGGIHRLLRALKCYTLDDNNKW